MFSVKEVVFDILIFSKLSGDEAATVLQFSDSYSVNMSTPVLAA